SSDFMDIAPARRPAARRRERGDGAELSLGGRAGQSSLRGSPRPGSRALSLPVARGKAGGTSQATSAVEPSERGRQQGDRRVPAARARHGAAPRLVVVLSELRTVLESPRPDAGRASIP